MDASLWQALANGDQSARDRLLTAHLSLVHHVARQVSRGLAADFNFDEFVSAGTMGLMSALDSFDPSRGLAFSTFAVPRIRGAILDELRRQDHVPRSVRRKTRDIAGARQALTQTLGRVPEDRELAEHLEVDLETLWRWQADVQSAVQVSLDRSPSESSDHTQPTSEFLAEDVHASMDDQLTLSQEGAILRHAILRLTERERTVLSLYYYEELKLHEIAAVLELTESRVSQLHTKALGKLRAELAPLRAGDA